MLPGRCRRTWTSCGLSTRTGSAVTSARVREVLAATDEAFELFHLDCEGIEDHGDCVLAVNEVRARGRASGAEIRQPLVQIAEFRDGKCVWFQSVRTSAEALKAVGLEE
jgi:ketosteroid isomerase-like protein